MISSDLTLSFVFAAIAWGLFEVKEWLIPTPEQSSADSVDHVCLLGHRLLETDDQFSKGYKDSTVNPQFEAGHLTALSYIDDRPFNVAFPDFASKFGAQIGDTITLDARDSRGHPVKLLQAEWKTPNWTLFLYQVIDIGDHNRVKTEVALGANSFTTMTPSKTIDTSDN